jgi:hypothetical protein
VAGELGTIYKGSFDGTDKNVHKFSKNVKYIIERAKIHSFII